MQRVNRLALTVLALVMSLTVSAAAKPIGSGKYLFAQPNASGPPTIEGQPFTIVRVFYGTDRNAIPTPKGLRFGSRRAPSLALGSCTVSIPKDHRLGEWEKPTILTLTFSVDQSKHVVLLSTTRIERTDFSRQLRQRVMSHGKEAFVFVHGYNVTFDEAVQRTALLAYDLKFNGVPIAFSWPSRGHLADYPADEESAEYAIPDLEDFLSLVAKESGATKIHLIAHSMGNRTLLGALSRLRAEGRAPTNLAEAVLTAPDVDRDIFVQLVRSAITTVSRVTLYASSRDKALTASRRFHDDARAGEGGARILLMSAIDSVDVSAVSTDFIGHSYFGDNRSVISDLFYLIRLGAPPDLRVCLSRRRSTPPYFWVFDRCRD